MKRGILEQRCSCESCTRVGRKTHASRAVCRRCHEPVLVLHWHDQNPLAHGTCPECGHYVDLLITEPPMTDVSGFEEAIHAA